MANKFQKFVAKVLGFVSKEDFLDLKKQNQTLLDNYRRVQSEFRQLRDNMETLYGECRSDIDRVDNKIAKVKPILKVEDEEAVRFIKGILSRHDTNMQNNQSALHSNILAFQKAMRDADIATLKANEAASKLNNVLNGLGLDDEISQDKVITSLREFIVNKVQSEKTIVD